MQMEIYLLFIYFYISFATSLNFYLPHSRAEIPFINATKFFKNNEIPYDSSIENYFDLFDNVYKFYNSVLRKSIEDLNLKRDHKLYYTYVVVNGSALKEIYSDFDNLSLIKSKPTTKHFGIFKKRTFYGGKGIDTRMMSHVENGKKIKLKRLRRNMISAKFSKICDIWEKGDGISVLKLFSECNQHEALSREYAIIKAIGLNNLTNVICGTCYGAMKSWSDTEVINFGNMMLMNI